MAKGKSSVGFWVLISTLLVGGGIGAYFLFRKPKDELNGNDESDKDESESSYSTSFTPTSKPTAPAELNTTAKIKAFQDWMDNEGKGWILKDGKWGFLNKGAGYGNYGKSTDAVWKVYGKDYLKSLSPTSTPTSTSTQTETALSKDIDLIIKNATGKNSEKNYLLKASSEYVKKWANAIRNKRKAFIWANQVYRTFTGTRVLNYDPINKIHYAKKSGYLAHKDINSKSGSGSRVKGNSIGKVTDVTFNREVWLYVADGGFNKWYKANDVTVVNPKSSFEGGKNNLEFSSFDNNLDLNL
jgi:hypothetical protein